MHKNISYIALLYCCLLFHPFVLISCLDIDFKHKSYKENKLIKNSPKKSVRVLDETGEPVLHVLVINTMSKLVYTIS